MHHGVAHLDAGRKAVEHETSDFALENRDEIGKVMKILRRAVNRGGEMAFQRAGNPEDLIAVGVAHEKRGGAKDFCIQVRAQKCICIRFKKR